MIEQQNQSASQLIQPKRFYSVREATTVCETSRDSIRRLFLNGTLEGRRIGGLIKLEKNSVDAYAGINDKQTAAAGQ